MATDLTPYIELWEQTLSLLKANTEIKSTSYESWFAPLKVLDCRNNKIYLGTNTSFILKWINDNYSDVLRQSLKEATDNTLTDFHMVLILPDGSYEIEDDIEEEAAPVKEQPKSETKSDYLSYSYDTHLNPNYTFDTFVVGHYNRFAHAAALAVAEKPGKVYNPLFIQGGVGLGKTHLMQAIGHFIKENNREAKVAYFTTEKFVNEWIHAIQNNTPDQFRAKYRKYDVILMDDIQFLSNKESSQEEFFHTYNALYESGAQIILSSDRPPLEIPKLEERLVSRFVWGLTSDIQSPDLETRIAILQKKATINNVIVSNPEVFVYIANHYSSNIRVLEGALNRVVAFSQMKEEPITLALTKEALKNFVTENRTKEITVELILQTTAKYFNIEPESLISQKRTAQITYPRQIAMYLCRELTNATFEKIGEEFGKRHYSTVMHAAQEIANRIESDNATQKRVKEITEAIKKM